jgi:hypothetical protein
MSLVNDFYLKLTFKNDTTVNLTATNRLVGFSMLLEMDNSGEWFKGSISANELNFGLENTDSQFMNTNSLSPYVGLLEENVKVEVFEGLVRLGTFYIKEWITPNTSAKKVASVRAVDRLQSVINSPVDLLGMNSNIMLKDYIKKIFLNLGFLESDLLIDQSLTQMLNYTVIGGTKLSNVLNDISLSGDCYFYMNKDDKLVVISKVVTGIPTRTITDTAEVGIKATLYDVTPSKSMMASANLLNLGYTNLTLSPVKQLASIRDYMSKVGISKTDPFKVENGNMYEVDHVRVESEFDVEVTDVTPTQNTFVLDINNPHTVPVSTDITLFGKTIDLINTYIERQDDLLVQKYGRKEMKLECKLIQDMESASALADKLWTRINIPVPYLVGRLHEPNFNYNLGEISEVKALTVNLSFIGYIHSLKYNWAGGEAVRIEIGIKGI